MQFGVCVPNYGETCSPDALRAVAVEAEQSGFDSVWCTDHILIPRNSGTPYERIYDSITSLAYLASVTSRVRLGISSLITAMRNPVVVAKQLATVDNLSNGRVMLATSAGWNQKEFSNLGSNFHNRGRKLDESIRLIRTLWSGGRSFEGRVLRQKFDDALFEPPPVQKHLTIWIGGTSRAAMKRAVTLGDGWHPNVQPLDEFAKLVSEFKESFPEAGEKEIGVRIALSLKSEKGEYITVTGQRRVILSSNKSENERILNRLEELGVSYVVVVPSHDGKASVASQVEGLKMIAKDFL